MSAAPARATGPAVLLAAAVAGLSWAPTFTLSPLVLPVLGPLLTVLAVDQLTLDRRGAPLLRPVLGLVFGSAALVLTLVLVRGASAAAVLDGVLTGWQRTLDSTLPAYPDVTAMAFVPALALLAGVLGIEWAYRGAGSVATLLPSTAVLVFGQLFRAAAGAEAVAVVTAFGLAGILVLLADQPGPARRRRFAIRFGPLLVTVVVAGLAAGATSGLALPGRPTVSIQDDRSAARTVNAPDPLAQVATLLAAGEHVAFHASTDAPVDRWPLVVLDRFDGTNWSADARLRLLGTQLPTSTVAAPVTLTHAEISGVTLDGPWLPSQARLRSANGIHPFVDPTTDVLVRADGDPDHYALSWNEIRIDAHLLTAAAIEQHPVGAVELTGVPAGIADLARRAVGPNAAPTVQAALVLERWMRDNYRVATGSNLPTGHSTAQLLHFLDDDKVGTSEQFASSYALMASSVGIPVRVVVGFRDDGSTTVHDDDVLAWPEIAVSGLGWVPLDPTGGARNSSADRSGLAAATQAARDELPSPSQLATQQPGDPLPPEEVPVRSGGVPLWPAAVLVLMVVAAVPTAKEIRRRLRRRGPTKVAVANAWRDTRDSLRDYGVAVPPGSTVRDAIGVAPAAGNDLEALARYVDAALWAGREPESTLVDQAWGAAATIRRGLRAYGSRRRVIALFAAGSLRPDRPQPVGQSAHSE